MLGRKLLLVTIGLMCMNTSAHAAWTKIECLRKCTINICTDKKQQDLCNSNCTSETLEACHSATLKAPEGVVSYSQKSSETGQKKDAGQASGNVRASHKLPLKPLPTLPPRAKKEDISQDMLLAMEQIKMLKEASEIAEKCHSLASERAAKGSVDPQKFEQMIQDMKENGAEKSIFPNNAESIFNINPKFCSETTDYTKMDRQSFVSTLKNQTQTTKTMLADILNKILGWKSFSEVGKYRTNISGDLRALSSFCLAPLKMLDQAIEYKKKNPTEVKKKSAFGKFKDKFMGRKN